MTSGIFGDRVVVVRQPAWHSLGHVIPEPMPVTLAVETYGLNYKVQSVPLVAQVTPDTMVPVEGGAAIMREPTADDPQWRVFGTAGDEWHVMQNMRVAELLDQLSPTWPLETVGALGYGETVFWTLKVGEMAIRGDAIMQYFLFKHSFKPGVADELAYTPVRVVCQNTLYTGLKQSIARAKMAHHTRMDEDATDRIALIKSAQDALTNTNAAFEKLAAATLESGQMDELLEAAYVMPSRPSRAMLLDDVTMDDAIAGGSLFTRAQQAQYGYESDRQAVLAHRENVGNLFAKLSDEYPGIGGTAWAAYNAVVEYEDYYRGRADGENAAASKLWGRRAGAKHRAFSAAAAIAGI